MPASASSGRFRFTLRSLLLLVTVAAVFFALNRALVVAWGVEVLSIVYFALVVGLTIFGFAIVLAVAIATSITTVSRMGSWIDRKRRPQPQDERETDEPRIPEE